MVIDHLCRNRRCVNPAHLDQVTQQENLLRAPATFQAINAAKTACPQEHEYTPENTYLKRQSQGRSGFARVCRECERARRRRNHPSGKALAA
jgi:hypothetical protein